MDIGSKILTGAAATFLLALLGHAATGEQFISSLEQRAQTELAARGLDGASVSVGRDPLSRSAVLDGEVTDDLKQQALRVVKATPGISSASWKGVEAIHPPEGDGPATPGSTATADDKIATCQNNVDKIIETNGISFRSGSAYLSLETKQVLDQLTSALQSCDGLPITVEGHTDDNGSSEVNRYMSQERADRIKAGLVERGIPEALITATGYGSTRLLTEGSGAAADAQNRRIDIRISAPTAPSQNSPINDAKVQQENLSIPLLLENLLLLLVTFAIGLAIGWFFWGRNTEEY